jgi:O-antigen/teichoic acid export membrane protein
MKFLQRMGISARMAREGALIFALRVVSALLGFGATVLLARALGAGGYGIFAHVLAWMMFLTMPAEAGVPNLIVRETSAGLARSAWGQIKGVWLWSARTVSLAALALIGLSGLGAWLVRVLWGMDDAYWMTFLVGLALIPLLAGMNGLSAALRGLRQVVEGQFAEFFLRPALFLLLALLAMGLGGVFSPALALALQAVAIAAGGLYAAWRLRARVPRQVALAEAQTDGQAWLASSWLFTLIAGFGVVNYHASTLVLGMFAAPEQVGVFRVALQIAALAAFGLQSVNVVIAPRFARLYAEKDMPALQRLVTISARLVLVFNLVVTVLFVWLGAPFLRLFFGTEFVAAYLPMVILLVGQTLNAATGSVGFLLNMTGNERETMRGMGLAAGANLALNLVLIPCLGITGTAIATTVAMILWNILLWIAVKKQLGINSLAFVMGKR